MTIDSARDEAQAFMDLLNRPVEPLVPMLEAYMCEGPLGCPMLKHPLVFSLMVHPQEHARLNAMLQYKIDALAKAKADKKWNTAAFLYERPYRLDAFMDIADELTDAEYWKLLGQIWTDSENIHQNRDEWAELLTANRPDRHLLMSDEERDLLAALPETGIPVYRGFMHDDAEDGLSWTLFKARARWFAKRFHTSDEDEYPRIASGTVDRKNVIAHFTNRDEMEIVVLPEHVNDWSVQDA